MTSTNIHIGFGSGIKSSSKVLKPPGGGSSDIFGGTGYDTPRSGNKNQATSNIFAQPEGMSNNGLTPRRGRNNDSHNRLFGEPDRSVTQGKNHSRSNIPIGGDEPDRKSSVSSVPLKTASVSSNGQSNGKMENGGSQTNISNGNKESEDAHHLGEPTNVDGLDNLDTRSVRSHQSTESLLLANNNPSYEITNNNEINQDDFNYEKSINDNNNAVTKNINDLDTISNKDADVNVSRIQNNNIFGEGNNQLNLKYARRNMETRNCVTGAGIESPHYSARKLGTRRDGGNPVTGEGYTGSRNGLDSNPQVPAANVATQATTKNRVPPGGFSSGLW